MKPRNETPQGEVIENRLRALRQARGFSQGELARRAGVTRQAIYAVELNEYLPSTAIALRLADVLECKVEDLFSIPSGGDIIEGDLLLGRAPTGHATGAAHPGTRVKVARVGERVVVRPVAALGDVLNFTVGADGLMLQAAGRARARRAEGARVKVRLLRDRRAIEEEVLVAGCDPSVFLIGEHLRRRRDLAAVVGWTMGSGAALAALQRGEVHVAGVHILDSRSGESNLPYLRRHLKNQDVKIVTFAAWTQGLMLPRGNPKRIRSIADLARPDVRLVNREDGAGARLLLDGRLATAGIRANQVRGYNRLAGSHLEVARLIAQGHADVGLGVEAAARFEGLDFLPLQSERYDLVMPSAFFHSHPGLSKLLDTLVSRPFRTEIEALGGYDTTDTGKEHALPAEQPPRKTPRPPRSR